MTVFPWQHCEKYLDVPRVLPTTCGRITYNVALGEDNTPSYTNMIVDMDV